MAYTMKLGRAGIPASCVIKQDARETVGEVELVADGGCAWGRSHAQRAGKFSARNSVNREDWKGSVAKLTDRRAPYKDEKVPGSSDEVVNKFLGVDRAFLDELNTWERVGGCVDVREERQKALEKSRGKKLIYVRVA